MTKKIENIRGAHLPIWMTVVAFLLMAFVFQPRALAGDAAALLLSPSSATAPSVEKVAWAGAGQKEGHQTIDPDPRIPVPSFTHGDQSVPVGHSVMLQWDAEYPPDGFSPESREFHTYRESGLGSSGSGITSQSYLEFSSVYRVNEVHAYSVRQCFTPCHEKDSACSEKRGVMGAAEQACGGWSAVTLVYSGVIQWPAESTPEIAGSIYDEQSQKVNLTWLALRPERISNSVYEVEMSGPVQAGAEPDFDLVATQVESSIGLPVQEAGQYFFRVRQCVAYSCTDYSPSVGIDVPLPPELLSDPTPWESGTVPNWLHGDLQLHSGPVNLSWTAVPQTGALPVWYRLSIGDQAHEVEGTSFSYVPSGPGRYRAQVRQCTPRDCSPSSRMLTIAYGVSDDDTGGIDEFSENYAFIHSGPHPSQQGLETAALRAELAAVVRGRVLDSALGALPGVKVTVKGAPEFGESTTDSDGYFNLMLNAQAQTTLEYASAGRPRVQRMLNVRPGQIRSAPDVVMIALDSRSTVVQSHHATPQIAEATPVEDEDGVRTVRMFFPPETGARMVLKNGTQVDLTTLSVRASEYTVGSTGRQAMPGPLPSTSAYNYAVELSVDEAIAADARIAEFSNPVAVYVENFNQMPVGGAVPSGYYDYDAQAWIASENGRIIEILPGPGAEFAQIDIDGDALADGAAALGELGIDDDERRALALLYPSGANLWRVPITHFTPWDFNWPYSLPPGAEPPTALDDLHDWLRWLSQCLSGSVVECQNQVLRTRFDAPETGLSLNYRSDVQLGNARRRHIHVPLWNGQTPPPLKYIQLAFDIAGRKYPVVLDRTTLESSDGYYIFRAWDGLDAFGRVPAGAVIASVTLDYVYDAFAYSVPADFERSFARMPNPDWISPVQVDRERREITLSQTRQYAVGGWDAKSHGMGGLSIAGVNQLDPVAGKVHRGDGAVQQVGNGGEVISTMAGRVGATPAAQSVDIANLGASPVEGYRIEGLQPTAIAQLDGRTFIADYNRVYLLDEDGMMRRVAGGGALAPGFTPGNALDFDLGAIAAISYHSGRGLLIATANPGRVYLLSGQGQLSHFAGNGSSAYAFSATDDGLPARAVAIGAPTAMAASGDGFVYLAHTVQRGSGGAFSCYYSVLRRIDPDGSIYTVFGRDVSACSGLGSPQTTLNNLQVAQANIEAVAVDSRGGVLLGIGVGGWSFPAPYSVLRVTASGQVEWLAGNGGSPSFSNVLLPTRTGAAATQIPLHPTGLVADQNGGFFIAERATSGGLGVYTALTHVSGEGVATHRGGSYNCPGDRYVDEGILAVRSPACDIVGLGVSIDGSIVIADRGLRRIRRVSNQSLVARDGVYAVPSIDGETVDVFDLKGRHLETRNAYTGVTLLSVAHDEGVPAEIRDTFGNRVQIQRAADTATLVGPDRLPVIVRGGIAAESAGYANSLEGQLSGHWAVQFDAGKLLGLRSPGVESGGSWTKSYQFHADGRLLAYGNVEGAWTVLERDERRFGYDVETLSAEGRTHAQSVEVRSNGATREVSIDANGLMTRTEDCGNGVSFRRLPNAVSVMTSQEPDQRFGFGAPNASMEYWVGGRLTSGGCEARLFENDGYWSGEADTDAPALAFTLLQRRTIVPGAGGDSLRPDQVSETATFVPRVVLPESGVPVACDSIARTGRDACRTYRSEFDRQSMTFTYTSPMGRVVRERINPAGDVLELEVPGVLPVRYGYDDRGRLQFVRQGERVTGMAYHAGGDVGTATVADASGSLRMVRSRTTAESPVDIRTYDITDGGRHSTVTREDSTTVVTELDDNRHLRRITMPGLPGQPGVQHDYEYSALGRATSYQSPGGDTTTVAYSQDGDVHEVTLASGTPDQRTIAYQYELGRDRLAHVDFSAGRVAYAYDAHTGAVASATAPGNVALQWEYLGALLSAEVLTTPYFEVRQQHVYDSTLWLTQSQVGTQVITYDFDLDGLLTRAGSLVLDRRADTGAVEAREIGVVSEQVHAFSEYGQVQRVGVEAAATLSAEVSYEYDLLGRITQRSETTQLGAAPATTAVERYGYDALGQLIEVRSAAGAVLQRFGYDARGNRTHVDGVLASVYADDDRLLSNGGETYAYRASGELQTRSVGGQTTQYDYDEFGNLRRVVLPGGTQLDYLVDARNRRVGVLRNGVFEKGWSYRDTLKPSAQIGPGGVVQQVYVYGDLPHVPAYIIDLVGSRTLRVVSDERGSVRWVVDTSSGEVVQALRYGPWGEVVHDSQPGFQPFGYAGGLTDPDTGLVRFGARDYAPWLGRWTSPDPIGQAGGLNVYAYAGNDPINYIDPSGHESLMCTLVRELLGQVPGMQLAMALMDPNATAWDIAAAVAAEMPWNRALKAAKGVAAIAAVAARGHGGVKGLGNQNPFYKTAAQKFKATGLSNAGRALTKHPEMVGKTKDTLRQSLRTEGAINAAAHAALREIMRKGVTTTPTLGRYGTVTQTQIPGGFGARWASDGSFIGFINP